MAHAQSVTGTILGNVLDPSGLAIPRAEVALTQPATALERRTTTAENGSFAFPSLAPGAYNITVKLEGFKQAERRAINLSASETLSVGDILMQVGSTTESVTITAQGANVQTASAERSGVDTVVSFDRSIDRVESEFVSTSDLNWSLASAVAPQ